MSPIPISVFESRLPAMLTQLCAMIELESPTDDKDSIDRLSRFVKEEAIAMSAEVEEYPQLDAGNHMTFQWGSDGGGILIMTHLDTVYPIGTIERMPIREQEGRLYGPGVLDMKAGVVITLSAVRALIDSGSMRPHRITLLCTSDEETGSETSRSLIEDLAKDHDLVLCLEPALPDGSLKTWRKGIGVFHLETLGIAAHAGAVPNPGVNAILEMTYQIQEILSMADSEKGTSINVGVIHGGTRSNVIPELCRAEIDIRIMELEEQERLNAALEMLSPKLEGAQVRIEGEWNRPPMERSALMIDTFNRAKEIAKGLGLELNEGGTGGGSDANFVALLGVPVLDGLGAVGEGAHSPKENILISSLPERTALVAALISDWL
ncbi:MAG: M20/M25/M40 family metallo-hydrolase [Anaerolineales bacterium]|nr:M20/M25/M40 family metallo-hydrolase [Anaerolineales bacterium]